LVVQVVINAANGRTRGASPVGNPAESSRVGDLFEAGAIFTRVTANFAA
jgi:hypothetical protein